MPSRFTPYAEKWISRFRGFPDGDNENRGAAPLPLGSILQTCIEKHRIGQRTPEESILQNWSRIVGESYSQRCRPERLDRSGALIVQVPNATLRRELLFMENRILTAVASLPGCQHVNRVVLKAGQ